MPCTIHLQWSGVVIIEMVVAAGRSLVVADADLSVVLCLGYMEVCPPQLASSV